MVQPFQSGNKIIYITCIYFLILKCYIRALLPFDTQNVKFINKA